MATIFELIDAGDAAGIRELTARDRDAAAAKDEQGLSAIMRAAYRGGDVFVAVREAAPPLGPFDRIVVGESDGLRRFADRLRSAGHTVHTPDLYDGRTFETIDEGMAHAEELDFQMGIVERGRAAVEALPSDAYYVGFSLGVMPAQSLAQTRP